MKRTKAEKGITLIALIITVIVLIILAVVTIQAVQEHGIIGYAKKAQEEYKKAQEAESQTIQQYLFSIPTGYKRVEYLETTGTQWIDTELDCENKATKVTYQAEDQYNTWGNPIIGSNIGNAVGYHCTLFRDKYYYGNKTAEINSGSADYGKVHTVEYNFKKGRLVVDGEIIDAEESEPMSGNTIYIGKRIVNNIYSKMKYYSFTIYQKDTEELVANYIPVLDDKDVPCMYDSVSGKTFYNKGTGDFQYGPIV